MYSIVSIVIFAKIIFDETNSIPNIKIQIIKHNLESTPIIDILRRENCENVDTSNNLGYYYSTAVHKQITYQYFKGKRLYISKSPKKLILII